MPPERRRSRGGRDQRREEGKVRQSGEGRREEGKVNGWFFTFGFGTLLAPAVCVLFLPGCLMIPFVPSFPYHPPYSGPGVS